MTTASPTSTSLSAHQTWVRVRGLLLALTVLVVAGVVMALMRSDTQHGLLDPRSPDPKGSRAVAELLEQRGVGTQVVTTLDEATAATGPGTTLLVTTPDLLTPHQQERLRDDMDATERTVLLAPGPPSVGILAPGVSAESTTSVSALAPRCRLAAAERAGAVDLGGERYTTDLPGSHACYPSDGLATLLRIDGPTGDTVLLGSPTFLHNERLAEQGNASLALQLLGSRPHLVWYLPSLDDPSAAGGDGETGGRDDTDRTFVELIPSGWLWGTLQLALAAVLAALWRARRLGPLVTEHLPVVVRASEAAEGRARLYRRANARDRAATVLRTATRTRLAPLLGVPPAQAHAPESLLPAVSARLASADRDLGALLFGPAPADDAALTLLADQLDALEREVRTS
ncbi:DUF4350 domain-containing protein [Streptomyces ficellus]|uniref:DUF4350 domain-containing protein n=1 Tax=Streptomyces ficellus TaxID=1977088 RepID=A0A6I6FLU9_9ACTN|nr:DUF4350 domain-containing protein [Streptomyces ficellus]QGV80315.1 DUF4350 domain-containing protein [Streptomyces ficellus]